MKQCNASCTELLLNATDKLPPITFVSPAKPPPKPKILLILPGGGYQKVMVKKEGTVIARHFASQGFVSFVCDYPIGPRGTLSIRAKNVQPIIDSAMATLNFIRESASDPRFGGNLDLSAIALVGFSAGGHLSLCLCEQDKLKNTSYPPIHAALLIYPTLRSPTCWCVAGGLWIVPSIFGQRFFKDKGEHCFCYGSCPSAMSRLMPTLPPHVMCVTVSGDMLLPAFKHSRILVAAMEKAGKVARYLHAGPFYLYHGCGLHSCWGEDGKEFFREAFNLVDDGQQKDKTRM
ncbi:hypothetical protein TrVE_jg13788 [Triparma verrucosa]|uniref:BD-FAE-like domain-containing protein n=1 Tax=Triparma verrucosa TaxID=1606542 RepID=A0A9W7C4B3_9STRA|nr:hypothetical protein TrVE_jg13788 [Triparma verrucosa]